MYLMQTDPNWSNFLYDEATQSINLIDFGAARNYPKRFVDDYLRMVGFLCHSDKGFKQKFIKNKSNLQEWSLPNLCKMTCLPLLFLKKLKYLKKKRYLIR